MVSGLQFFSEGDQSLAVCDHVRHAGANIRLDIADASDCWTCNSRHIGSVKLRAGSGEVTHKGEKRSGLAAS